MAAPHSNGATAATHATRVLLIEPNARLRRVVQRLLELEGYLVWPAADTDSGLAVLRAARRPLLVLLTVSSADVTHSDLRGLLLRAATISRTITWPQHAFLVATTSPEYLCAVIDWLPEGMAPPVLRQPYDLEHLLRTVALTAYRLEIRQRSALRLLPPRQRPATTASSLTLPAWMAEPVTPVAATLDAPAAEADTAGACPSEEDRASTAADCPAAAAALLTVPLREDVERMRAIAQQTWNVLGRTADVIARAYATHRRLVAANDRWSV